MHAANHVSLKFQNTSIDVLIVRYISGEETVIYLISNLTNNKYKESILIYHNQC